MTHAGDTAVASGDVEFATLADFTPSSVVTMRAWLVCLFHGGFCLIHSAATGTMKPNGAAILCLYLAKCAYQMCLSQEVCIIAACSKCADLRDEWQDDSRIIIGSSRL